MYVKWPEVYHERGHRTPFHVRGRGYVFRTIRLDLTSMNGNRQTAPKQCVFDQTNSTFEMCFELKIYGYLSLPVGCNQLGYRVQRKSCI